MPLSIFLAQIFALVYVVVGFSILINRSYYVKMLKDVQKSPFAFYAGGVLALIIGFLIITNHTAWEISWKGVLTFLGLMSFLKGVFHLLFPEMAMRAVEYFAMKKTLLSVLGFLILVLGLYLGYYGIYLPGI